MSEDRHGPRSLRYRESGRSNSRGIFAKATRGWHPGDPKHTTVSVSVEKTAEIGRKSGEIGVLCCCGNERYDEVMKDGVRAMGAGL